MAKGKGIAGVVSCWGYGYSVRLIVNGKDAGLSGGGSEGIRIFSPDHEMYAEASPAIRERLFILRDGKNEISVEFNRSSKNDAEYLQIAVELEGYPAPVYLLHSRSKDSGAVKTTVEMHAVPPEGFRPTITSDSGENRAALVHVDASNCSVTPSLNGQEMMTLMMRGQVVLENVNPGKNELAVRYGGTIGEELKITLVTPEWVKVIARRIEDESEKTETFAFGAQGDGKAPAAKPAGQGVREAPASGTGETGEAALEMLKSSDALKRFMAAAALREAMERGEDIGFAESALNNALSDKDADARNAAARLLSSFYCKKKRWADINRMLEHARGDVRVSALFVLDKFAGDFDLRSDIPNLVKSLDYHDFEVRAGAACFFEKAAAKGIDISPAIPSLKKAVIYGDERVKESVANAVKSHEMRSSPGVRCQKCLDCETGFGPGDAAKCFEDMALIIKSISCCGGDVTHKVQRCSACGKHYLSTYFDHSDTGHGQFSIKLIGKEDAERIAAEFKKCPNPEFRLCKCTVHMEYLKGEKVPIGGELKYNFEDTD